MRALRSLALFSIVCVWTAAAQQPSDVVARVGDVAITRADLANEIPDQYKAQYARVTGELRETQRQAVRELLGTREMERIAKQRHIDVEQLYRETIARELENFSPDAQAKIHQIETSVDEADRLTLEEIIDRRLYDEAKRRAIAIDTKIAPNDIEFLRDYENARRNHAQSTDPIEKQIADAAEEARQAVLRKRVIEAARAVVKVERFLEAPRVHVAADGFPRLGKPDAPVQLVVFTDFECPYCAETEPVLHQLFDKYRDDLSIVMRDYPMANRIHAMPSAIAARCAFAQGKYWPYHDLLFANRTALTEENFRAFAGQVGLDVDAFARCEANPATRVAIEREVEQGRAYGVDATPTLFLNGRLLSGTQTVERLSRLVEEEKKRRPSPRQ